MIRVLVVDDDPMVRRLLDSILSSQGINVVAGAGDGDEVVTAVQAHYPDVVLMDLRMPRMSGIDATVQVRHLPNPPGVLAMTSMDSEGVIMDAVNAGVDGFLAKDAGPEEIVAAVRAVSNGDGALSPRAARVVMRQAGRTADDRDRNEARRLVSQLTPKELELAAAARLGLSNREIGDKHFVSEATVKTHLRRAMEKVGTDNRVVLGVLVDRSGVVP